MTSKPLDILLINCPSTLSYGESEYQRVIPPIGLGYIAQYVGDRGFTAEILDCEQDRLTVEQIADAVRARQPRYVGVNCYTSGFPFFRRIHEAVAPLGVGILAGSPHPSAKPEDFEEMAVLVVRGYGERVVHRLLREGRPIDAFEVQSDYKVDADIVQMHVDPAVYPRYDFVRADGKREASYITSRSCPYTCTYCMSANSSFLLRDVDRVAKEIARDIAARGVGSVHFLDDLIFPSNRHIRTFIETCERHGIAGRFTWRGLLSISALDKIDPDLLERSACESISVGFESGVDRLLAVCGKKYTAAKGVEVLEKFAGTRVKFKLFFMIGLPSETVEETRQTIEFVRRVRGIASVQDVNIFQFKPYPGTALYRTYFENRNITFYDEDMRARPGGSASIQVNQNLAKETHFCEHDLLPMPVEWYKDMILQGYRDFYAA